MMRNPIDDKRKGYAISEGSMNINNKAFFIYLIKYGMVLMPYL
jgi:hypothetical protein